ncbi:MAG: hypothetical protein J7K94_02010 [Dehalococcoidia bacterium]|nr:hypothetical protein [Dehalococcoidia bacterium]
MPVEISERWWVQRNGGWGMKAIFHRDIGEEEEVEIKDIFVDEEGEPKMLFVGEDGRTDTAPINRFTNCENIRQETNEHVN